LPAGADVSVLRFVLGRSLPATAKVMADGTKGESVTLKDTDPVPEAIAVTDFRGSRTYFVHMSLEQTREAMRMIRAFLRKPETQRKVEALEAEACGNRFALSLLVSRMYAREVYPAICRRNGFSEDALDPETFPYLCGPHLRTSLEDSFLWLEVEALGRQWTGAEDGLNHVNRFRGGMGLQPICTWQEFYEVVGPIEKDRVEAMDYLRRTMGELLQPI